MMTKKSRYIPLTQQPYCCVPTCLQMVLLRRKQRMMSQEDIGYQLGLTVPKSKKRLLPKARTGKRPDAGWGTQVGKPQYSINRFFEINNIPLKEEYITLQQIGNIKEWIAEQMKEDRDILVCFNHGKLYGGNAQGHVSIIDSIENDIVILIDPESNVPKYRKVKIDKLTKAIEFHAERTDRAGFWIIRPKETGRDFV
jgi:hypothetical protein